MKRKIFIGSSTEGHHVALQLKSIIENECSSWLEVVLWNEKNVFKQNKSFLESLHIASRRFDYGVFVATADDRTWFRNSLKTLPRDNVVFELGMFLGSLGLTRAFLVSDVKIKLPSDYNGVTVSKFNSKKSFSKANVEGLLNGLKETKETFNMKPIPSSSLALGYFESLIVNFAKSVHSKEGVLKVILPTTNDNIQSLIDKHKELYPTIEVGLFETQKRPSVFKYEQEECRYWDIPTTLSTLAKLISIATPTNEIGRSSYDKDWFEYEMRNFQGTLEMLINDSLLARGKVVFEWLN